MEGKILTDHIVDGDTSQPVCVAIGDQTSTEMLNTKLLKDQNPELKHDYTIYYTETLPDNMYNIKFQKGPVKETGINGITNEVLLAIVIDRLRGFQAGAFACIENDLALAEIEKALNRLNERTEDRILRGVEGTSKV